MLEEPTFTESEEKTISKERMKISADSLTPFFCILLLALGVLFQTIETEALENIEDFEEDWETPLDWSCGYCGSSNSGESDTCCACGGSK